MGLGLGLWTILCDAQDILLPLCSEIIPEGLRELSGVLEIEHKLTKPYLAIITQSPYLPFFTYLYISTTTLFQCNIIIVSQLNLSIHHLYSVPAFIYQGYSHPPTSPIMLILSTKSSLLNILS